MKVRHSMLWAFGSQYTSFAVQFITSIYLARTYILPETLGLFSVAFAATATIAVIQDFGLNRYIVGTQNLDDTTIRTAYSISFLIALSITSIILLLAWPISLAYKKPELLSVLLVLGCSYLIVPFATIPIALRQRAMDFRAVSAAEISASCANALVSISMAYFGMGAMALAGGVFAQQIARSAVAQWCNGFLSPWPFSFKGARPILRFGRENSMLTINGAISLRVPDLIIGAFLTEMAVGLYSRATGLVSQLRIITSGAATSVFYPTFARVRNLGEPLGPPYLRVVAVYSAVSWPALTALAVAAEPLVLLLYGERWIGTVTLIKWIAMSECCLLALPLHVEIPLILGRVRMLLICNYVETIVAVGLLLLAATIGLEWIAISRMVYTLIWYVIYFPFLYNIVKFDLTALINIYFRSMIVTIVTVAPFLLSYHFWRTPSELGIFGLLVCTFAGITCWALALFIFRHPMASEINNLLSDAMKIKLSE